MSCSWNLFNTRLQHNTIQFTPFDINDLSWFSKLTTPDYEEISSLLKKPKIKICVLAIAVTYFSSNCI